MKLHWTNDNMAELKSRLVWKAFSLLFYFFILLAWVGASENLFSTFLHTWVQQEGRLPQMLPQVLRMGVLNMFSRPAYKDHPSIIFPSNGWKPKWCRRLGCYVGLKTATHDTWLVWEGKCEDDTAIATPSKFKYIIFMEDVPFS